MGKIAQVSSKYIINATLKAEGLIDRPDIIGAIFGQTEGLLGKEMELRELQKTGRIGRIDVESSDKDGKTTAHIKIPSSLDKTQTAIIAAAIETIERIGPCNGKIILDKIEDVRSEKRDYIQERAKEILSKLIKEGEDSGEIQKEVSTSVKEAEVISYGADKVSAGPDVDSGEELIIVEGRADVLALLRAGVTNVVSVNGTIIPRTVIDLMKTKKVVTVFIDGDRGGELILKSIKQFGRVDFLARAPDGKEVEELTGKEIIKCLRSKESVPNEEVSEKPRRYDNDERAHQSGNVKNADFFRGIMDDIAGKGVARIYNADLKLLGEIPVSDLRSVRALGDVNAIVADAPVNDSLLYIAQDSNAQVLVGTKIETRKRSRVKILTKRTL